MATKPAAKKTAAAPSTALAKKPSTALVDVQAALKQQLAGLAERTVPDTGAAIRVTQDKQFKFPDGTATPGPFQGVVVDFVATRDYYKGAFNKDNPEPPACFAISPQPKGMVPSDRSPEKQSDSCESCPHNQWGSDGGRGKACKEGRKLAVLPPDATDETPVWMLKISPTAVKSFDGYVSIVARQFGLPPIGVISDIGFDPANSYATVRLSNPQENTQVGVHFDRQSEAQEMLAVEPDVSSFGQAPAAPVRGKPKTPVRR